MKSKKMLLGVLLTLAVSFSAFNLFAEEGNDDDWNGNWKICEHTTYDDNGVIINREWYCCHTNTGNMTYDECFAALGVGTN